MSIVPNTEKHPQSSILSPSTPPRTFLAALLLLHLPPPCRLSFLQLLDPLRLSRRRFIGDRFAPNREQKVVQSPKASIGVIYLLARIVGLDDQRIRLRRVIAGAEDCWAEDCWEKREERGGWEAERGFGGDSVVWLSYDTDYSLLATIEALTY